LITNFQGANILLVYAEARQHAQNNGWQRKRWSRKLENQIKTSVDQTK
jgi:hypothetical protein